jgi:hypothetical protein
MYCPKCGAPNADDVHVCVSCGQALPGPTAASPVQVKTSGLAIAAFVLGLLGLFTCGLTLIPAVVLGIIALVAISRSGGRLTGRAFAIIGMVVPLPPLILAGLLMPALQQAKTQAREMVCRANLRQYGIAAAIYLDENDDKYPDPWTSLVKTEQPVMGYQRYCRWHDPRYPADGPLWTYVPDAKVSLCPTFGTLAESCGAQHPNHDPSIPVVPYYSYSMNAFLGSKRTTMEGSLSGGSVAKRSEITRSKAEVFFFAEENVWVRPGCSSVLNDTVLIPDGRDWFGTFHGAKRGDLNSGTINVVFVDAHVDKVKSGLQTVNAAADTSGAEDHAGRKCEKFGWPYKPSAGNP